MAGSADSGALRVAGSTSGSTGAPSATGRWLRRDLVDTAARDHVEKMRADKQTREQSLHRILSQTTQ